MKSAKSKLFHHVMEPGGISDAFPLPPARSDMCRDAFLKKLLLDYESTEETQTSLDTLHFHKPSKHLKFDDKYGSLMNHEDILMREHIASAGKRRSQSITTTSPKTSRIIATDILKVMYDRKWSMTAAIGFIGVLFQLRELKNRLRIMRELWKVDISLDKSFRMFSWCHRDYYNRFGKRDTTYLDITERTLGDQKECYKFNIDIREITRLVAAIDDDIRKKRDICTNSMRLISEAKLDIVNVLKNLKKQTDEAHAYTVLEVCRMPRSADPHQSIRFKTNKNLEISDFLYPIEARYRIKWTETQAEENKMRNDRGINKMLEELTHLQTTTIESSFIWQSSSAAYEMQIASLRNRIIKMEVEYERRIGLVDDEKKVLQNKYKQAVEDLKKCKDSIPFFHQRIAEVNLILNPPVEEEPEPEPEPVKTKKKEKVEPVKTKKKEKVEPVKTKKKGKGKK